MQPVITLCYSWDIVWRMCYNLIHPRWSHHSKCDFHQHKPKGICVWTIQWMVAWTDWARGFEPAGMGEKEGGHSRFFVSRAVLLCFLIWSLTEMSLETKCWDVRNNTLADSSTDDPKFPLCSKSQRWNRLVCVVWKTSPFRSWRISWLFWGLLDSRHKGLSSSTGVW